MDSSFFVEFKGRISSLVGGSAHNQLSLSLIFIPFPYVAVSRPPARPPAPITVATVIRHFLCWPRRRALLFPGGSLHIMSHGTSRESCTSSPGEENRLRYCPLFRGRSARDLELVGMPATLSRYRAGRAKGCTLLPSRGITRGI